MAKNISFQSKYPFLILNSAKSCFSRAVHLAYFLAKISAIKIFNTNAALRNKHSLFSTRCKRGYFLWNTMHTEYKKGSCVHTVFQILDRLFRRNTYMITTALESLACISFHWHMRSLVPGVPPVVSNGWWSWSYTWLPNELGTTF